MNLQETLELIRVLKASGVTKFKSLEHDIVLSGSIPEQVVVEPIVKSTPVIPTPDTPNQYELDLQAKQNAEATEKIKDLIKTVSMTPEELANHMFKVDGAE